MSILGWILALGLLLLGFWAANKYLPDDPPVRLIVNLLLIAILILALLSVFGLLGPLTGPALRLR